MSMLTMSRTSLRKTEVFLFIQKINLEHTFIFCTAFYDQKLRPSMTAHNRSNTYKRIYQN